MTPPVRNLIVVFGDQLDAEAAAFDDFDPRKDAVAMAEVAAESEHVWSAKMRTALFLSAMRHFRDALRLRGRFVRYVELDAEGNSQTLEGELRRSALALRPERIVATEPGDWRTRESLIKSAASLGLPLDIREDRSFLCSAAEFRRHAATRKELRMEYFYRDMRRRYRVLVDPEGEPLGGRWNFDHDNRESFGRKGPPPLRAPMRFPPDRVTKDVLALVERRFPDHPGSLAEFDWPVTAEDAAAALDDFIAHRLPSFGRYQDAIWTGEPWLFHSRLSTAMNLKLLAPRDVVRAAEAAGANGHAPLASVEGFIRQILGWREYVRGVYWLRMPDYADLNALDAHEPLPAFYWTGDADMVCLRDAVGQTLRLGYAHHIQRLMVTGLYAMLLGVSPRAVHEWYLAVYVDAVEWAELPNTLGMSQYADGGLMASKPYAASGKYIQGMSNACAECRFDPTRSVGDDACPFTTLYWDFLLRHEKRLALNVRMALQLKNLARLKPADRKAIRAAAAALRANGGRPPEAASLFPTAGPDRT